MKKHLAILLLTFNFLLSTFNLKAQPTIQWQKSYGGSNLDRAYSIQLTTDGGYVVVGISVSADGDVTVNKGEGDFWIVKIDSIGIIQWQQSYGGSYGDYAVAVQQTTDGGYVVAGTSRSNDGDVTGHHNAINFGDCWVIKLDNVGNLIWGKSYGGSGDDNANSIQQTIDGGYIVAGKAASLDGDISAYLGGNSDYWVFKLDSSGNLLWEKSYGGTGDEEASSVRQTDDGGYIVAGSSNSTNGDITNPKGGYDYWIVKIDSIGTIEWEKSFGGNGGDGAYSLQKTIDGGFVIAGDGKSTVIKIDSVGNLLWEKSYFYGGGTINFPSTDALALTNDRGYIISGTTSQNDYWLLKIDSLGNLQWQKTMGGTGTDIARAVQQTTDGGFIVAGYTMSTDGDVTFNNGAQDYWVVKLNPVVGIDELSNKANVLVYPNPSFNGIFSISIPNHTTCISIYNSFGKLISKNEEPTSKNLSINLSNQAAGLYFITLQINGQLITKKIIYQP